MHSSFANDLFAIHGHHDPVMQWYACHMLGLPSQCGNISMRTPVRNFTHAVYKLPDPQIHTNTEQQLDLCTNSMTCLPPMLCISIHAYACVRTPAAFVLLCTWAHQSSTRLHHPRIGTSYAFGPHYLHLIINAADALAQLTSADVSQKDAARWLSIRCPIGSLLALPQIS